MILVRPARSDDIPALAELGLRAWHQGIGPLVSQAIIDRFERCNPFFPFLEQQGAGILVGELNGIVAGLGASETSDNSISDLWVSPEHEGKGVGTALLHALEDSIRTKGFEASRLSVAVGNVRAHDLYVHLGYSEVWRGERYDPILDRMLEKIDLEKPLPNQMATRLGKGT
ncbi:GNAT family N-acetyltransferase [uncultured Cohaesibacter sp.]|uniref:GNAT family N-acetyltransferase n=1 Tax=uncultured Cohaesibacter sp. TaxID=1002546 RepID=UPI00292E1AF8|nr:GNAT family N-acetyltransferase [uncultured Cohaesibacter sp.]